MPPPPQVKSDAPFPTQQLLVIALCRLAEPLAFTSILAYVFLMVVDLHGGDETNASFYAGLLVSAFPVGEAISAMFWGSVSDRYGRKPIVLLGLAGTALSSLLFGFAQKFWIALIARIIGGLLNGNVAVMQTMIAEMVTNPDHEPTAYAIIPFMWNLGSIVGSAMGGFLAQPARFYPDIFPQDGLFGKFPYLLPNLVSVIGIILAIIQGCFLLKETNPTSQGSSDPTPAVDEHTPLVRTDSRISAIDSGITGRRRISAVDSISTGHRRPSFIAGGISTVNEPNFDLRRGSLGTIHSIRIVSKNQYTRDHELPTNTDDESEGKAFTYPVIMLTVALIIMAYHTMAYGALIPIYLLDEPTADHHGLDFWGGLGYTVHDVGSYMAVNGVICLLIQGLIFPPFLKRVGVWNSFIWLTILTPISYILVPFLSALPRRGIPAGIYGSLTLQAFFGILIYPCNLILLKNAAPSAAVLGKINGLAMSACSAARTIAPPLVGIIYGPAGSAAAWWSCAIFAIVGAVQLYWIPREQVDSVVIEPAFSRRKSTAEGGSMSQVEESG